MPIADEYFSAYLKFAGTRTALLDRFASIGLTHWNYRLDHYDRSVELWVKDPPTPAQVRAVYAMGFEKFWAHVGKEGEETVEIFHSLTQATADLGVA